MSLNRDFIKSFKSFLLKLRYNLILNVVVLIEKYFLIVFDKANYFIRYKYITFIFIIFSNTRKFKKIKNVNYGNLDLAPIKNCLFGTFKFI